jgi:2,5-diamino-6-(ribosylamino)-4(3H)-pyrimidinone 5'-phosphate reductase
MSIDGKIASPTRKQMRISCDEDIERMYKLRNTCDAVLVGIETILSDDPKLTVKEQYMKQPKQPLRVVLDTKGRTPLRSFVLNDTAKTLIITAKGIKKSFNGSHIEIVECEIDRNGLIDLKCVLDSLYKKGIRILLVEGGGTVIWNFLNKRLADDLYIFIGSFVIGGSGTPTIAEGEGISSEEDVILMKIIEVKRMGSGLLIHYQPLN